MRHAVTWLREHPRAADGLLAAGVAVMGVTSHLVALEHEGESVADPSVAGVLLCLLASVPLLWRRTSPLPVLVVVTLAQAALEVVDAAGPGWMGVLVAAFSLGRHHAGRRLWWITGTFVGAVAVFVIGGVTIGEAPWQAAASTLVVVPAVVVFGDSLRLRRKRLDDLAERAERAERERELVARQHVQDERARIARELHDVVAHSVSVMVIQAGAARRQLTTNPERANAALEAIEATGRAAMTEMRRILGVLRAADADADTGARPLAPAPTLEELPELVRADPDLPVELTVRGDLAGVPTGLGIDAYRLVQEALTNVRRHAGRIGAVRVTVTRGSDRLEVEVVDDGRGASTLHDPAAAVGHGLIGMRERVASSGGQLTAGPRTGGGWRVHAVLPLGCAAGEDRLADVRA